MNLETILRRLSCELWCILPAVYDGLVSKFHMDLRAHMTSTNAIYQGKAPWEDESAYRKPTLENGVAVIPLEGIMLKRLQAIDKWWFGATDVEEVERWLADAIANPAVKAIVLDVNSPGGSIVGVPELAESVARARATKPIITHTSMIAASAAYYVSAGADAIYCSLSAVVGSIGVYTSFLNWTKFFESMGVSVELFKSGVLKAAGLPGTDLNDAQRADFQEGVDNAFKLFKNFVTQYRDVPDEAMIGGSYFGHETEGTGLVDSITSLEQAKADALKLAEIRTKGK